MSSLTFSNARIVLRDEVVTGSLHVQDGLIAQVDGRHSSVPDALDLDGDYLMPGFVEVHTDNFERHLMPRPKTHWPALPALIAHDAEIAAAGITTVLDALGIGDIEHDSLRGGDMNVVVQAMDDAVARDVLRADHHLHVRCELPAPNTQALFAAFDGHPRLSLLSLMDHTPGQRQWEDINQARIYYTGKKGWSEEKFQHQLTHAASIQAEHVAPNRAFFVDYCQRHGVALASHDDTTTAHVDQAHAEGARISEFPTTVEAARHAHALGLLTVMGGPNVVRGGSHSGNVSAAELARLGLMDMLSSDYVPGSLLTAVWRLVDDHLLNLPQAVATVSANPALACKMSDRGVIEAGRRADLVQVRRVTMPDGRHHGVVRAVWRQGVRVI